MQVVALEFVMLDEDVARSDDRELTIRLALLQARLESPSDLFPNRRDMTAATESFDSTQDDLDALLEQEDFSIEFVSTGEPDRDEVTTMLREAENGLAMTIEDMDEFRVVGD